MDSGYQPTVVDSARNQGASRPSPARSTPRHSPRPGPGAVAGGSDGRRGEQWPPATMTLKPGMRGPRAPARPARPHRPPKARHARAQEWNHGRMSPMTRPAQAGEIRAIIWRDGQETATALSLGRISEELDDPGSLVWIDLT